MVFTPWIVEVPRWRAFAALSIGLGRGSDHLSGADPLPQFDPDALEVGDMGGGGRGAPPWLCGT